MKDMTVSKALKWIFIAEILCLLAFIPVVGAVLALIGFILNLVALYGYNSRSRCVIVKSGAGSL